MKRLIYSMPIFLVSALLLFSSCKKDDQYYLQNLAGTWIYSDASTGYTSSLTIEDILGGQYAYCITMSPTKMIEGQSEGSFIYDGETGYGYIKSDLVGAPIISVESIKGNNGQINVTYSTTDGGGIHSQTNTFTLVPATSLVTLPTGKWDGSVNIKSVKVDISMDVTSSAPIHSSCGTITMTSGTESIESNIDSISQLVPTGNDNIALGIIKSTKSSEQISFVVEYNLVSKDLTIISDEISATLKSENLN